MHLTLYNPIPIKPLTLILAVLLLTLKDFTTKLVHQKVKNAHLITSNEANTNKVFKILTKLQLNIKTMPKLFNTKRRDLNAK